MIENFASLIVVFFGAAICALTAWGIGAPESLRKLVAKVIEQKWGIQFAAAVRIVLGVALIFAAPESRFPTIFYWLGWFAIAAAIVLAVAGRKLMSRLVAWFMQFSAAVIRLWHLFGVAFGAFLLYSIL